MWEIIIFIYLSIIMIIMIIIISIRMIIITTIMISITGISSSMSNYIINITILHLHHLLSIGQQKCHSHSYLRSQRWRKDDCTEGMAYYVIVHIITTPTTIIFSYLYHHYHYYHHLCNLSNHQHHHHHSCNLNYHLNHQSHRYHHPHHNRQQVCSLWWQDMLFPCLLNQVINKEMKYSYIIIGWM